MPGRILLQCVMRARSLYLWLRLSDISELIFTLVVQRMDSVLHFSPEPKAADLKFSTQSQYNKEPQCRGKPRQGWHTGAKLMSQHWGCHSSTGDTLRRMMCSVRDSWHHTAMSLWSGCYTGDSWSQVSFVWNVRSCVLEGFFSSCNSPVMSISVCFQQK